MPPSLDLLPLFLYNSSMKEKRNAWIYLLRALFLTLTACALMFIFFQSAQDGEASAAQSVQVTVQVQEIVGAIAPDSPIATATGEDFDLLHAFVRGTAHFLEYAFLGACAFASYLSFTRRKRWAWLVPGLVAGVAVMDEILQSFRAGRAAEFLDVFIDVCGGIIGCGCTLAAFFIIVLCVNAVRRKQDEKESRYE